jgi:hypothetical protein
MHTTEWIGKLIVIDEISMVVGCILLANTLKIWRNQHNVHGRFFTISILINDIPLSLVNIQPIFTFKKLTQKK